MATTDYAMQILSDSSAGTLYSALGTNVSKTVAQWNRTAPLLSKLELEEGSGKAVIFDAEFAASTTPTFTAENADYNFGTDGYCDDRIQAVLQWAQVSLPIQMSNKAQAAAKRNANPADLANLLDRNIANAMAMFAKTINTALYNGNGTSPNIAGLWNSSTVGAIAAGESYAGISRSTYAAWAGSPASQPSAGTAITVDLIEQARVAIQIASGLEPDLLAVSPNTLRVLKSLFNGSSYRRWDASQTADTAHDELYISGMRVFADYCISETDGYGKIYMLNSSTLKVQILPPAINDGDFVIPVISSNGQIQQQIPLPILVQPLARSGTYSRWGLSSMLQLVCTRPNANAYIGNLSLTVS